MLIVNPRLQEVLQRILKIITTDFCPILLLNSFRTRFTNEQNSTFAKKTLGFIILLMDEQENL